MLAVIVGFGIWEISAVNTKQAISASQRASQYAKDTDQQILEACTVAELSAMRECVTEKVKASEENQRAAKDLVAQEDVAEWTFWILFIGIIGTGVTGLGLYYLAANLEEIREQQRLMRIELSPAMSFAEQCDFEMSEKHINVTCMISNLGKIAVDTIAPHAVVVFSDLVIRGNFFRVPLQGMTMIDVKPGEKRKASFFAVVDETFPTEPFRHVYAETTGFQVTMQLRGTDATHRGAGDFEPKLMSTSVFYKDGPTTTVQVGKHIVKVGKLTRRHW